MIQPPVCRVCGHRHWFVEPHRFRGARPRWFYSSLGEGVPLAGGGRSNPPVGDVALAEGPDRRGPKEMSDEELKPYHLEWMRRAMSRRRGKKM